MQTESKYAKHTKLVLDMADRQGLDLAEMFMRAEFSEDELEHAVSRCVGCSQPEACSTLLESEPREIDLPAYCRNGDLFAELKSR